MAGGHGNGPAPVKIDAGVEAWNSMRDNVYKTFKFTNKTTRLSVIWGLIVPVTAYYIIASQDQKWDFAGKGRSDSILKRPPPSPTPDAE